MKAARRTPAPAPMDAPYAGLDNKNRPINHGQPHLLVSGRTGSGKALALGTQIPTPTGFTRMRDIAVGDTVFGRDGTPCTVTTVWDVIEHPELYRLTLSDGQQILADAEHQWVVSSFADRNRHKSKKRVKAIESRTAAHDLIVAMGELEPTVTGDIALPDIHEWLLGLLPGAQPFFRSESSFRLILDELAVPYTQRRRQFTRVYKDTRIEQTHIRPHYPVKAALEVMLEHWNRGGHTDTPKGRTTRSRREAVTAVLNAGVDPQEWLSLHDIIGRLIDHGGIFPDYKNRSYGSAVTWLADAGITTEDRPSLIVTERTAPASQVLFGRPTRHYERQAVLKALITTLERRYEHRPVDRTTEQTLTTAELIDGAVNLTGGQSNWAIRLPDALDLPDADLPVDPYVLGQWLGDGSLHRTDFTHWGQPAEPGQISDLDHFREQLQAAGYEPSVPSGSTGNRVYVSATTLGADLARAGVLDRKHIPMRYLRASRAQRLALLQGLMDTDGTVGADGGCSFGSSTLRLADDALALVRSLGIKASLATDKKPTYTHKGERRTGKTHRFFNFTTTEPVFRLARKAQRLPTSVRETQQWLYIVDIETIEPEHPDYEPARCIAVDSPDATFLAGAGFVPTHNSQSCLAPNIVMWHRRPVVAVSSKADLAELTAAKRASRGPVYVMDLSGEVNFDKIGVPVTRVASDPTLLVHDDDSALELAALLLEVGSLGGGDSGGGGGNDAFWKSLAMKPLAALLRAAASYRSGEDGKFKLVSGGGIAWALAAAENHGDDGDGDDDRPLDLTTPSWTTAANRCNVSQSAHGRSISNALSLDGAQRDSIGINMSVALNAWALAAVREPSGGGDVVPFRPEMLLSEPGATLYIVSPITGAAAPAATATLTSLVNHWRKRVGEIPNLLMVIDELPNTSPLPRLAAWIGEARGLGIRIVAAVQASSQFEPRWGSAGLKVLRDLFPAVLIFPGAPEPELLDAALWMTPSSERVTASLDAAGNVSHSHGAAAAPTKADLMPPAGHARLLVLGQAGHLVKMVNIHSTNLLD